MSPDPPDRHAAANARSPGLVAATLAGDRAAAGELYELWYDPVWRFLARLCHGKGIDPSDLVGELWLVLLPELPRYDPTRRFSAWLFRFAWNRYRTEVRRRLPELGQDDDPTARLPDPAATPEVRAALDQSRRHAQDCLDALPDRARSAVLLGLVEEMDHNELGEALELKPAAARKVLSRARSMLRACLEGKGVRVEA